MLPKATISYQVGDNRIALWQIGGQVIVTNTWTNKSFLCHFGLIEGIDILDACIEAVPKPWQFIN
jgi:hypothetical protein